MDPGLFKGVQLQALTIYGSSSHNPSLSGQVTLEEKKLRHFCRRRCAIVNTPSLSMRGLNKHAI